MESMEDKVVKQVEYYFGDINLPKDRFLQEEMRMNGDGWVRLSELMKFNRLKKLCDDDSRVISILASNCTLLEVDANERRVRRRVERALPRDKFAFARDLLPRTVYVKGFRRDATLDDVQAYFVRCGVEPEAIRMRRRRGFEDKGGQKHSASDDDDEDDEGDDENNGKATEATAEGDTKPKNAAGDTEAKTGGKYAFKGSVFAIFRSLGDAERFKKLPQASSDEKADAAVFEASVPFLKQFKSEYFREKKQATKDKRRAVQSAFQSAKGNVAGAAPQQKDGGAPGERQFERGMLLRITDVPQALLDFNELKKLFSEAGVDIFADLVTASNAAVVRIKRAPSDLTQPEGEKKAVGAIIWGKLCTKFGSADVQGENKLPALTYKGSQLHAEVIVGEEEDRFWKDLFAKWEANPSNKQQRKGKNKQKMGKRGKRKWNDRGKRNGKKGGDDDDDDSGSDDDNQAKRQKGSDDDE